ncbi:MAG TPA: hypothetical protein VF021_05855 [Longimicrobiales bacterium]
MSAREEHIRIARSARLYRLGEPESARELWVVCHGYGQLPRRFIREFEHLASPERYIVAPEGLHRFYIDPPPAPAAKRRVGATWMTREDRETDIADYVAYLDAVVAHVQGAVPGPMRVTALGFSQGTSTVFRWAVLGATPIARLILWAGELPPDVDMAQARQRLAGTRVVVVRGRTDSYASEQAVQGELARLDQNGIPATVRVFAGAHELDSALLAEIAAER